MVIHYVEEKQNKIKKVRRLTCRRVETNNIGSSIKVLLEQQHEEIKTSEFH